MASLELERMSTAEKLRALEEIWADLSRNPEDVPAPDWHREELASREARVSDGTARFEGWDTVKQRLKNRDR